MEEKISEAIKNAIEGAPERKFVESLDIAFTIKDVDLKNPNNELLKLVYTFEREVLVLKIRHEVSNIS